MDTRPLSPSAGRKHITEPQIDKLKTAFGAALRKANPFSDDAQFIIEREWDLVWDDLLAANEAVIRMHLSRLNTISFKVKVKRGLTGDQVLDGIGRVIYKGVDSAVSSMPLKVGSGEEAVEFVFFNPGLALEDADVEAERQKRGLVRDLAAQAKANADHPEFADRHMNGDSWLDAESKWCFAYFSTGGDGRHVFIRSKGEGQSRWGESYWFGGVRK